VVRTMKPELASTSVPPWTSVPVRPPVDLTGRSWSIVAIHAEDVVRAWTDELAERRPDATVRVHLVGTDAEASAAITADVAAAVVGWRLMLAGPADACLRMRALAIAAGVGDDELTVATTEVATRDVRCAHCGITTNAEVGLEGVVACSGCGRKLFVYYHVSRRLGAHLGFMVDAERPELAPS
jgi:dimethylamine monooxygenase subunit C